MHANRHATDVVDSIPAISFAEGETKGLVSIVIPTFRQEHFIADTLASVGRQTYPHWEVLVVEDGSRGATKNIVEQFARAHPSHRVDYARNEQNSGPAHARNVAFANARGEFVAMLDSDDRWFPDYLSAALKALHSSGKHVAYSSVVMIEDKTDLLLGVWGPDARDLEDFPYGLFRRNFINPSATILRRQVLADVGAWDTTLRCCEDVDFWFRCIAAGKQFHYVGGCHCLYRKNFAGAATEMACSTREKFAEVVQRYIQLPGLQEKTCRKLVCQALVRAAEFHVTTNARDDASADPSRAPGLALSAWRLRPKNVEYLWKAFQHRLGNLFHRRTSLPKGRISAATAQSPKRAAA